MTLTDHEFWILHSPYPDGTWRGLEKSAEATLDAETLQLKPLGEAAFGRDPGVPLLFPDQATAARFVETHKLEFLRPVRVLLIMPAVRAPLDAVPDRMVP